MIISASRRTDIPNYYSEWFTNRIKERYVLVRNPLNMHQISRIDLSPDVVDCIVFWTKNPKLMLGKLHLLKDYAYYFQFTVTPYGEDIEENVPSKNPNIIDTFKRLSDGIGRERVIWRYDPILLNDKYTIEYHTEIFGELTRRLVDYTEKCTISFMDDYAKIRSNIAALNLKSISSEHMATLTKNLSAIAFKSGLRMDTCAEDIELDSLGITHAKCIDDRLIERIAGYPIIAEKDRNQRLACGCVASIDIGAYNTCMSGCKYCYANHSNADVTVNSEKYDSQSPMLCSSLEKADKVSDRPVKSLRNNQLNFFNS